MNNLDGNIKKYKLSWLKCDYKWYINVNMYDKNVIIAYEIVCKYKYE